MPDQDVLVYLEKAISVANRNKDTLTEAKLYQTIGNMQLSKNGLETALESYQKAVTIYNTLLDKSNNIEKGKIYEEIGNIQVKCDDLDQAELNYRLAKDLYQTENEQEGVKRVERLIKKINFWKYPVMVQYSTPKVNRKGEIIETCQHTAKQYIRHLQKIFR